MNLLPMGNIVVPSPKKLNLVTPEECPVGSRRVNWAHLGTPTMAIFQMRFHVGFHLGIGVCLNEYIWIQKKNGRDTIARVCTLNIPKSSKTWAVRLPAVMLLRDIGHFRRCDEQIVSIPFSWQPQGPHRCGWVNNCAVSFHTAILCNCLEAINR